MSSVNTITSFRHSMKEIEKIYCILVMRILMIYSLSNFHIYCTAVLIILIINYIKSLIILNPYYLFFLNWKFVTLNHLQQFSFFTLSFFNSLRFSSSSCNNNLGTVVNKIGPFWFSKGNLLLAKASNLLKDYNIWVRLAEQMNLWISAFCTHSPILKNI